MMAAAPKLAEAVAMGIKNGAHPDNIAKTAYKRALWTQKTRLQRDFQAYGGDFLEQQPVCIGLYLYISISLYLYISILQLSQSVSSGALESPCLLIFFFFLSHIYILQ